MSLKIKLLQIQFINTKIFLKNRDKGMSFSLIFQIKISG